MKNKPTSLAITVLLLQIMTWLNVLGFIALIGIYIYGIATGQGAPVFAGLILVNNAPAAILGLFFAILFYFTASGLLKQKKWARISTIIIGVLMLFGFPIGTAIGTVMIYGVTKGWPEEILVKE